jgi:hypothetical protein
MASFVTVIKINTLTLHNKTPTRSKKQEHVLASSKKTSNTFYIFGRIQKSFYFGKTNIKTFSKHPLNINNQLKTRSNKKQQYFHALIKI